MWSVRCMMYLVCYRGIKGVKMIEKYNFASLLLKGFIFKYVFVCYFFWNSVKINVYVCFVFYWCFVIFIF